MAFKDYEDLDVTKEIASPKELKQLKRKYKVEEEKQIEQRTVLKCTGIALLLTIATVLIYRNIAVIPLGIELGIMLLAGYFCIYEITIITIDSLIKKSDIKENIWLLIFEVIIFMAFTCFFVIILAPVTATIKKLLMVIASILFVLTFISLCIGRIIEIKNE